MAKKKTEEQESQAEETSIVDQVVETVADAAGVVADVVTSGAAESTRTLQVHIGCHLTDVNTSTLPDVPLAFSKQILEVEHGAGFD